MDMSTLWNEKVREMAVADGIVTMTKSNEIAGTFVIADAFVSVSAMLVYIHQKKNIAQVLFLSDIFLFPFIRQQFPVLT